MKRKGGALLDIANFLSLILSLAMKGNKIDAEIFFYSLLLVNLLKVFCLFRYISWWIPSDTLQKPIHLCLSAFPMYLEMI